MTDMKKHFALFAASALTLAQLTAFSQTSVDALKNRYESLVNRVGYSGPGVELVLDRWEAASPEDADMLVARFNFYLDKSASTQVVEKNQAKFMGAKPIISLKDSLGRDVNYFQETFYEDSLFARASQAIDRAIKLYPDRLDLRFARITSLIAYEKESPDMATSALNALIDYDGTSHPVWMFGFEPAEDDVFTSGMQEYCATFYSIGSPTSLESFRSLSERMLKYHPSSTLALTNLGTYYQVARKDSKTALKYYNKVLKMEPDNYTAIKNCVLLARKDKNVKLEKKYLPMLAKYGADETEKLSAQARLDALSSKKK